MPTKRSVEERFAEKYLPQDGCWNWTSAVCNGYGFFWVGGKKRSEFAHRMAWVIANGCAIPEGLVVMHSCDNKLCVNPDHLSLGTHQENMADRDTKKRQAYGVRNGGGVKLDDAKAAIIKQARGKESRKTLAERFGVHEGTIKSIWRGRIWKHV